MASVQFSDYCFGFINTAISAAQTTIPVTLNVASRPIPSVALGNYFYATLVDTLSFTNGVVPPASWEVVKVTANAAGTWTVTRNVSSSTGAGVAFALGDRFEVRIPAQALSDIAASTAPIYTPPYTGGVTRTGNSKWSDVVSIDDFGAAGNYNTVTGTGTDDSATFLAAANALLAAGGGGTIFLNPNKRYYIGTILNLPRNIVIAGSFFMGNAGGDPGTAAQCRYDTCGSTLAVSSAAYISLGANSGLRNLIVYRAGIVWPVTSVAGFTGDGVVSAGDDTLLRDMMILGFNRCFLSNGFGRSRIQNVGMDGNNGMFITSAGDVPYIYGVHAWPFTNVNTFGVSTDLNRSGTAFTITTNGDQAKFTSCFAFGYAIGFSCVNGTELTFEQCSVDGSNPTGVGFDVSGTSVVHLIGCGAFSQLKGINYTGSATLNVIGGSFSQSGLAASAGLTHAGTGDVNVTGALFASTQYAVTTSVATGRVSLNDCKFTGHLTKTFNNAGLCPALIIGAGCSFSSPANPTFVAGVALPIPTVASAGAIALPGTGNVFSITGTTNISNIDTPWPGRIVTLSFAGILTVVNGGVGVNLRLNGNFTTAAGSTLTLIGVAFDNWREVARTP